MTDAQIKRRGGTCYTVLTYLCVTRSNQCSCGGTGYTARSLLLGHPTTLAASSSGNQQQHPTTPGAQPSPAHLTTDSRHEICLFTRGSLGLRPRSPPQPNNTWGSAMPMPWNRELHYNNHHEIYTILHNYHSIDMLGHRPRESNNTWGSAPAAQPMTHGASPCQCHGIGDFFTLPTILSD